MTQTIQHAAIEFKSGCLTLTPKRAYDQSEGEIHLTSMRGKPRPSGREDVNRVSTHKSFVRLPADLKSLIEEILSSAPGADDSAAKLI